MSHFAELDSENKVVRVVVADNNDPNGDEGYQWLIDNLGGTWLKTSYNSKIRGVYAGIDYTYNEEEDIFVTPQPYPSWTRNGSYWQAPVPAPVDENFYMWNEENQVWDFNPKMAE